MSDKTKFMNCYMDLHRAAVCIVKDSNNNSTVFLKHAMNILNSIDSQKAKLYSNSLKKMLSNPIDNKINYADKFLTLGLIIRPKIF